MYVSWFKSDFSESDWEEHVEKQSNLEQKETISAGIMIVQFALKCLQLLSQRDIYNKARKKTHEQKKNYNLEKKNKEISQWNSKNISISKILIKSKNYTKINGKLGK